MFTILLVAGNVSFRQILSDMLLLHFPLISVDEAGDGREALSKVEYRRPDLIFMDIQLPGENGLDVTKEIKRVYNDIVIVILTSSDLPEYRQQAFRNGADCFLSKADDSCIEDILAQVEGAMARGHATDSVQCRIRLATLARKPV
ncbi:MAG: response regulator transcription factor [Pseudomonadota bacterium]